MSNLISPITEALGQPAVRIQSPDGAQATVLLHGGQVVSWIPAGGKEQLYLSPHAQASEGQAVRGGVPVIFPQFAERGPDFSLPRHGLARTSTWAIESSTQGSDHTQVTLVLTDNDATRALWPHGFTLELTASISANRLDIELHAHNTGDTSWPFSAALHTYLAVSELTQVRLQGLDGCHYKDMMTGGEALEDHPEKRFHGEMDRIYACVPELLLSDGTRRLVIATSGMPDAVIWNPGPDKCAALNDMPPDGWQHMLCVEAARIYEPLTLAPDESWTGRQSLTLHTP
ncbi:MAG: D-hexose-6-phosphate mutarotase [Aquabacterium sp.]|nr:D-hexose-6-phosphate mutarotase [Aquabacterium sp.]